MKKNIQYTLKSSWVAQKVTEKVLELTKKNVGCPMSWGSENFVPIKFPEKKTIDLWVYKKK